MAQGNFNGVLVPVMTPFTADLTPDANRFIDLCKSLLDDGAAGLAIFGTTSEANSMSVAERADLLDRLIDAGVPAAKLMPGTGGCALSDVVAMSAKAAAAGCGGVLLLPPFFYKGVSDDGVFAFVSEAIERVGNAALNVYLYHIPPQAVVGFSLDLVGRLIAAYPDTVCGLKDSSGDWSNTKALLDAYPDFDIFPGSEVFLLDGLRAGGAGCITATGNVNVAGIAAVYDNWQGDDADALQARATEIRKTIQAYPLVPALKAMMARANDDPTWARVAPPMMALEDAAVDSLHADLDASSFALNPMRAPVDA
jgi:4-hydroxy-tetrahydrodipicolinate synthase